MNPMAHITSWMERGLSLAAPHFQRFAYWLDPWLLKAFHASQPLRDRLRPVWKEKLPSWWQKVMLAIGATFQVLTAPLRWTGAILRAIVGQVRLEYEPSGWLHRSRDGARWLHHKALALRRRMQDSARSLRSRDPVLFRVSATLAFTSLFIVASCSTLQIYRKVVQVRFTVTGPEYRKPLDTELPAPVMIKFSGPVVRLELVGKTVSVVSEPPISGTWTFTSDSTLQLQPATHWPPDTTYRVALNPGYFRTGTKLASDTAVIDSPEFKGNLISSVFYVDPKDPSIKKAVVTIGFTYPVDAVSLEEKIRLRYRDGVLSGKDLSHKLTVDPSGMMAYIHSDVLEIQEKDANIDFSAGSGIRGKEGGSTRRSINGSVPVPGRYSRFAIVDARIQLIRNDSYELDQVLFLETTSPADPDVMARNLSVYELPSDRPASPGTEAQKHYMWNRVDEIDAALLAKARRVPLTPIASSSDEGTIHSFRMNVTEGAYIFIQVEKGTGDLGQFLLKSAYQTIARVPAFQREVRIMHDGAILSLAGEKKISILSYDNDVLEVEISRVLPDQINHLVSQSYGSFKSPYFRNYAFNEDNIAKRYVERIQLNRQPGHRLQYASFDFSRYLALHGKRLDNGLFYIRVRGRLRAELQKPKRSAPRLTGPEDAAEASAPSGTDENETIPGADSENADGSNEASVAESEGDPSSDTAASDSDQSSYTRGAREDRRFILVSDLGIVVKASRNGGRDLFVQSFSRGMPVSGVQIQVLGKNGLPVSSKTTDAAGHVSLPSLSEFQHEQSPVAFVAKAGSDLSFLPFDREDRRLDFSRFETGGVHGADDRNRLSAFVFSDRGIYRPGDEIRGAILIKAGDWNRSLAGIPIQLSILDARGMEVHSRIIRLSASAFEEFHFRTEESSPTGSYDVRAFLISKDKEQEKKALLGSTSVRVEEFLPDRLRITAQFSGAPSENEGWAHPAGMNGQVTLMNLFGTPAQKKKVKGVLLLAPRFPSFPAFSGYRFFDPLRTNRTFRQELGTLETDDQGRVSFPLNLERFARGIYRVTFHADGYEAEGGRAVSAQTIAIVSPLETIIGIKSDGDAGYIHRNAKRELSIIAINSHLQRTGASGLVFRVVETRHVSSLVKREDGIYEYKSTIKEIPVSQSQLSIPAAGLSFQLPTQNGGDFVLSIMDAQGTELNRFEYSVVGQGNVARSLERNAELSLHLNGKDFAPGEEIEVSIRAPYAGAGLITIEKDRVYAHRWFQTTTESSLQRIRVPEGLEGNGYVNVTFVRSMQSKAIYASPLSYGVIPFSVSKRHRTASIQLNVPAEIRPGAPLAVHYSVDGPGRLVLYAVDEGILQVARYRTPDPLAHFFQKRALEVSTLQIVDQLLPEFSVVQSVMRTGGDADRLLGLNLNPFKRKRALPVAFWSGMKDVAGEGDVLFPIPDSFNGRVRVLAVFVREQSVGVAEKSTLVRGDFILSPSMPAYGAPGDEMEFSVNIANNARGSGKDLPVHVSARAEGSVSLVETTPITLKISERGEAVAHFRIKALQPGEGRVVFTASGAGKSSSQTETISVRPARPYITDVTSGMLVGGSDAVELSRDLYPEFRRMQVSISPVPLAWSAGFYQYLASYPYGCTEQLTSRGLAALVLKGRPELKKDPKEIEQMIQLAMSVLRARQNSDGAFGFWAANSFVDPFQTAHALLFLTEARERGWAIPDPVLKNGLSYLESLLNHPSDSSAHDRAFALYVLTRNGRLRVNDVNGLLGEISRLKGDEARLPSMYLAAVRKLMHQDADADTLFDQSQPVFVKRWFMGGFDPVAANSHYMYLLSRHFPGKFSVLGEKTMTSMLKDVRAGQISTISASSGILAIDAYIGLRKQSKLDLSVIEEHSDRSRAALAFPEALFAESALSPTTTKLLFKANSSLPAFYQVTLAGFDRRLPAPYAEGIEVSREFTDETGKAVHTVQVGDEVFVHLRLRALNEEKSNIAIVDLFPAGMEPVIEATSGDRQEPGSTPLSFGPALMRPNHVDLREDRVLVFAPATKKATEYVYRLRAVSMGTFVVPPLYAEAMYDRKVRSLTAENSFTVKGRQ